MSSTRKSALDYIEVLKRKAPEYLDLLTAETDDEFEAAFDAILEGTLTHLEKNRRNYKALNENGLSAALAGRMSIPGLTVSQEKNSGGHVDLTFEADHCTPARTILGEAKIYRGYKYHERGLAQLLDRYITGRECRSLLIVYVRKSDIKGLIGKLRDEMDGNLPLAQKEKTVIHTFKWSFLSTHTHSCGEDLRVCHVGCNLYVE